MLGSLPSKYSLSRDCTLGMRVEPPTSTISSIWDFFKPASSIAFFTGPMVLRNRSLLSSSKRARVRGSEKSSPSIRDSISTRTWCWLESERLARSASRRSFCTALTSPETSLPCLRLMSFMKYSMILWSKSSPPRCVSPLVETTSKTPLSMVRMETSKVPPPRSKTRMFFSPFLSRPYAIAAAVGSLMMRATFMPEMVPASLVAWRCASLKYAGTVTTAFLMSRPRYASAVSFILTRIIAEISSAWKTFLPSFSSTSMQGLLSFSTTLNGNILTSRCTSLSENLRPMRRFASNTVRVGLFVAWFFAASPIRRSVSVNATYEGVMRLPWSFAMISTLPLTYTPTHE